MNIATVAKFATVCMKQYIVEVSEIESEFPGYYPGFPCHPLSSTRRLSAARQGFLDFIYTLLFVFFYFCF